MDRQYSEPVNTFARDHISAHADWPTMHSKLPELRYLDCMNCGARLLDDAVAEGQGGRVALHESSEQRSKK